MLTAVASLAGFVVATVTALVLYAWVQEHRSDRIPVLLYHRFLSKTAFDRGEIASTERTYVCFDTDFAAEMQYLHDQGYTTLHLDEFLDVLEGRRPRPARPIVVTIDDGFRSVYLHAFPVLKRLGMKATFFVTPDPGSANFLKNAPLDVPATREELREMSDHGVAIESHGMTHRYLTRLDPATARWELSESKRVLADWFGKPVRFLAIPSGAYSGAVKRLTRATGYELVFASRKGTNHPRSDRFALRRLVVGRGFGAGGMAHLLRPGTGFQLRLASTAQNAVQGVIGTGGLDRLRLVILGLPFGPALIRRPLRLVAVAFGALLVLALLGLGAALLF